MSNFLKNPIVNLIVHGLLLVLPVVIAAPGDWKGWTLGSLLTLLYKALENKSQGLTVGGSARA